MFLRWLSSITTRRTLSTQTNRKPIGRIFFQEDVQRLLKDISRFNERKIFARKQVDKLNTPQMIFMTDRQLETAKEMAYENAKARLQMPPILDPDTSEPTVLSKDEEIAGYTKFKVMFIDISPGSSDRNRLMSVRETDGTLRFPTHDERSRLNHMYYPGESKSIECPKMFESENLARLLKDRQYIYILNRACVQFEPDDPRYVEVTSKVYNAIDERKLYHKLRSTRHFGPMSLYLAYNKRADGLIVDMINRGFREDAVKLVKIYNTCHDIEFDVENNDQSILDDYIVQHSLSSLL